MVEEPLWLLPKQSQRGLRVLQAVIFLQTPRVPGTYTSPGSPALQAWLEETEQEADVGTPTTAKGREMVLFPS